MRGTTLARLPLIPDFVDPSRISVTRKGVEKPILVDCGKNDVLPFRLIDGDILELVLKDSFQESLEAGKKVLLLTADFELGGEVEQGGLFGTVALLQNRNWTGEANFPNCTDVSVFREGDVNNVERYDFAKILPEDIFNQADHREQLLKLAPLQAGDWILVPPLSSEADEKTSDAAAKLLDRIRIAGEVVRAAQAPRDRVVPTPSR